MRDMPQGRYHLPLPQKTMETFVRLLFAPIEHGQSLVLLFRARAGRRALPKFLIANLELFKKEIKKGIENYAFYYIDPPELTEQTPLGYMTLFCQELASKDTSLPVSYPEAFKCVKELIAQKSKEKELVFFLNEFDEISFMNQNLANNLKALWQTNKTRIHFVFLPFEDISSKSLVQTYGQLSEVIMENTVSIPVLTDQDLEYIISRQEYFLKCKFPHSVKLAIKTVSNGNPYLIKTACRIFSRENNINNPQKFLENHYQIKLLKDEEIGQNKPLEINPQTGILMQKGKTVELNLTGKEYDLLVAFIKQKNQILNRDFIAEILWGKDSYEKYSDWAIDQFVHQLRIKLAISGLDKNLQTIRGKGYRYLDTS